MSEQPVDTSSHALPSHHHHQLRPRTDGDPDPLTSAWIRRLHLTPNMPPTPPLHQEADAGDPPPRIAGFGPFRWSPQPLRGAPIGAWDAITAAAPVGGGGDTSPMLSPFFRLPAQPVAHVAELPPARPQIGLGSSSGSGGGGFPGLSSSRMIAAGDHHAPGLPTGARGAAYPSYAADMVHRGAHHDIHDIQHNVIAQNFGRHAPSSSSQSDEPFSYWNMGRLQRNTTTSSISPVAADPGNFGKKRNADSNSFLPLKFRKLKGAI